MSTTIRWSKDSFPPPIIPAAMRLCNLYDYIQWHSRAMISPKWAVEISPQALLAEFKYSLARLQMLSCGKETSRTCTREYSFLSANDPSTPFAFSLVDFFFFLSFHWRLFTANPMIGFLSQQNVMAIKTSALILPWQGIGDNLLYSWIRKYNTACTSSLIFQNA